ncbi:MAG: hypothetical protein IPK20_17975 [Betaproteobacteria bacterium]|nr:hypothetical protein [Betaproteobacteria bacterium]
MEGSFVNSALLRPEGGTLMLQASGGVTNSGLIELQPGSRLHVVENWNNLGQVQMAGGALSGGQVQNGSTGLISGFGLIDGPVTNAGLLSVSGGSLSVSGSLANSGITHLGGTGNQLTGAGVLTNTGTVQGAGNVGMRVANSGTLEAIVGTLSFSALSNTNTATGTLVAGTGGKLLMTQGLATNAGLIQLGGGTYDNAGAAMANGPHRGRRHTAVGHHHQHQPDRVQLRREQYRRRHRQSGGGQAHREQRCPGHVRVSRDQRR